MKTILLVGATPPPWEGMATINKYVLESKLLASEFNLLHYNNKINDKFETISKISIGKILKLLFLYFYYPVYLIINKPNILYMPLSGSIKGILRDTPFILAAKILKMKVILHYHVSRYPRLFNSSRLFKKHVDFLLSKVDIHIITCEKLRFMFNNNKRIKNIRVVNNCSEDITNPGVRTLKEEGIFKVLFLSNMIQAKGIYDVLDCIPLVLNKAKTLNVNKKPLFLFVGEYQSGTDKNAINKYIEDNKLYDHVRIIGSRVGEEKEKILTESELLVFPSHEEAQPLVVIEAMSHGLPIITTRVGCIEEMIKDGINGYFVPVKSPEEISNKILSLLENTETAKRMGIENRKLYEERYSFSLFENNMLKVFKSIS